MKKTRICFVVPTHPSYMMGGSQYQVQLIIEDLLRRGDHEIHYIAQRAGETKGLPYRMHLLDGKRGVRIGQYVNRRPLLRLLHEIRPDVIYQRIAGGYTGICARYAKEMAVPLVFHISHEFDVQPSQFRKKGLFPFLDHRLQRQGIATATHIIAQTGNQNELLKKNFGREADMILYNFHPQPESDMGSEPRGTVRTVLWVANLKPLKQPELFIDLANRYQDRSDLRFVMIGRQMGPANTQHLQREQMAGIPNLTYRGELSQSAVNREISRADLLVNTSRQEGFSNTFIQAWMRGVGVLSLNSDPDRLFQREPVLGQVCGGDEVLLEDTFRKWTSTHASGSDMEKRKEFALRNFSLENIQRLLPLLGGEQT